MKKLKIVAMATGILLLAGCGNKPADKAGEVGVETKNDNGGVVSSIKDAMGLGKTMRCTYRIKDQNGESTVTTYVDGKKYATEMNIAGNKQRMVYNEEAMYTWQEGQKQGMKMTKACTEEMDANIPEDSESNEDIPEIDAEDAFDGAMDVKCEEVSNADFSIPNDVEFQDQCEMLKGIMKGLPQNMGGQNGVGGPNGIPGGINMPKLP